MKKRIAIIGASYFQLPLIETAKEMGYETHVFAWAANDVGEEAADYFYPISIVEKEKIGDLCRKIGICGICSIASDLAMLTVNYVAQELNLVGNTITSTLKSTNKYLMRKAFKENGDPSVDFILVNEKTELIKYREQLLFPVIVKPTDRSGSRGICEVFKYDDLAAAVKNAINESFEKKALIESFIEGKEYSVETISYKGVHRILAVTSKYTTGSPHYIEVLQREPALIENEYEDRIKRIIEHALKTLEIENGASHSEIKIDENGNIRIIEIGARMGGDCIGSDLVPYTTGYDYIKAVIEIACGEKPSLEIEKKEIVRSAEVRFILTGGDLDEFNRMKNEEPERIIRIVDDKHLDLVGKTTSSSNRAGCYIIRL